MIQIPGSQGLGQAVPATVNFREARGTPDAFGASIGRAVEGFGADMRRRELTEQQRAVQASELEVRQALAEREAADKGEALSVLQRTAEDMTLAADEIGEGVLGGTVDKRKAGQEWETLSRERITAALEGVPQAHRAAVQRDLERRAFTLGRASVGRAVRQRDQADARAGIESTLESTIRLYGTDPAGAEALMSSTLDSLGPAARMGPDDIGKAKQRWREDAQFTTGTAAVNAARTDPRAVAQAERVIGGLDQLTPQGREQLLDRLSIFRGQHQAAAERARRDAEAAQARRMRTAEAEFRSGMALAQEGILDPGEAERRLDSMRGTPYQQAFRQMLEQQRKTGPLAAQPVAGVRQALDAVNAQIARGGITEELAQQRETLGKVAAGQERDIASMGGLRAAAKRGVIVADQPLNFGAGMAAVGDQLRNRVIQADMVRGWAGSPQSPLYPEEAAALATMLSSADPVGFGQTVGALGSMIPAEQMAAIARQIDAKDKGLALALVAGTTQTTEGKAVAEFIRRGQQAVKDKAPETKGAEATALQEDLTKAIGDALPARLREDAIEAARLVYYGQKAAGRSVSVNGAVQLALGGPIIQHNGRALPVPAGVDGYTLRDRLEAYPRTEVERQAADGWILLAGARPMGVPEFLAELPNAQLEPAGRGRYTVRMNGSLALNKDRRPLVIEVTR